MYMAHERRQYLLRLLEQRGRLRSAELARELGVTDETIRTDMVALQKKGLLRRVHGGAEFVLPTQPATASPRLDVQLAQCVAGQVQAGMAIIVDATPFACVLATQLSGCPCTFITNSPRLLHQLSPAALPHRLICSGGELDKESGVLAPSADTAGLLRSLRPQLALLSPPALTPDALYYPSQPRADWAKLAVEYASRSIIAVAATALYAPATPHTAPCRPDLLVTEDNCPPEFDGIPLETVPYISPAAFAPSSGFDY